MGRMTHYNLQNVEALKTFTVLTKDEHEYGRMIVHVRKNPRFHHTQKVSPKMHIAVGYVLKFENFERNLCETPVRLYCTC